MRSPVQPPKFGDSKAERIARVQLWFAEGLTTICLGAACWMALAKLVGNDPPVLVMLASFAGVVHLGLVAGRAEARIRDEDG